MEDLKQLIRKRGVVKSSLTIFSNFLKEIQDKVELTELELIKLNDRLANSQKLLSDFNERQEEIEINCDESKIEEQLLERQTFENSFYDALATAKRILRKYNDVAEVQSQCSSAGTMQSQSNKTISVKLPDISLPKFDGKFEDWLEFRDTYKSLIHENTTLDDIQKFHYLRSALGGTAAVSISKIAYTSNNYEVAWKTLQNRFDNKKKLIYEHIKAIYSIESIQKPTSRNIQILTDDINKHLGSIEQLGQNIENWDPLLIFWFTNKLDSTSSLEWEREVTRKEDLPKLDDFLAFLQRRANFVSTLESKSNLSLTKHEIRGTIKENKPTNRTIVRSLATTNYICNYCKREHSIYTCPEFLNLSLPQKKEFVKGSNLCFNCLRSGHSSRRCRLGPCRECRQRHNTILHDKNDAHMSILSTQADANRSQFEASTSTTLSSGVAIPVPQQVILSTVCLLISDKLGRFHKIRALLDCGSQTSFITEQLLVKLGLDIQRTDLTIFGITNTNSKVDKKCRVFIRSNHSKFETHCNCYVLKQITGVMPSFPFSTRSWAIPNNITLADPLFYKPGPIDMLVGADIFWSILGENKLSLGKNMPLLYETAFGWVVSGQLGIKQTSSISCNLSVNQELLNTLSKFWEIEEVQGQKTLSDTEQFCEDNFINTTTRDEHGRFVVTMPLKQSSSNLGESRNQAEQRFYAVERKFKRDPLLCSRYREFMLEYRELHHMTLDNDSTNNSSVQYFMPHHGVMKESSLTTKLRVVFDASAPTSNGISLNNIQAVGPVLQDDLLSIILRFRKHNFVISADIAKMYRQILIAPQHRQLQKIVWRDHPNDNLNTYTLNTVTYGQTSASYLAIRCLFSLAAEVQDKYPEIADILRHDFYVDDLLTGASTLEQTQFIAKHISEVLSSGGFPLRKWCSNSVECLESLNSCDIDHDILEFQSDGKFKTLGLMWSCRSDKLLYNIHASPGKNKVTKRYILSVIAKIFDPLGLISPCTILAKVLMQRLWADGRSWDETLSGGLLETWKRFESELPLMNKVELSRQAICKNAETVQLHGFADASEKAYGACIYLRRVDSRGNIHVNLLCAKSKVAPVKAITIPRLELCAALLLSRLYEKVTASIKINFESSILWSDSTVALAWINTSSSLLKTFTSNRVSEIQTLTKGAEWRYIPTYDNPADIVSRGLYPSEILKSDLWWCGPTWLFEKAESWPVGHAKVIELPDLKSQTLSNITSVQPFHFPFERFSKFNRMQRTTAYILRFKNNCINKNNKSKGPLTIMELNAALNCLIKICQQESFASEIDALHGERKVKSINTLAGLSPFIDANNILRVGGRLKNSNYSFNKKHPILIHSKHQFSKLLFAHEHERLLHGGPQLLLSTIRESYWPISGRNLARITVKKCITCFKFTAKSIEPIMADLPKERVCPSSAFSIVGVDYAGPFLIKDRKGRGCRSTKCYIGVFVCLSTKAIHLELISSLSSEAFIQALYRFVSRRGKPHKILSDNGTNFVGAQRELTTFLKDNARTIFDDSTSKSIEWSFIPPYSPHFGGLWEAAVKSVKHH